MNIRPGLQIDDDALRGFCRRHRIRRLSLFGSATASSFRADSDVDVLVEFFPGPKPGLLRIAQMEMELGGLLGGREVELRTYEDLSRHFRDAIREHATVIYDAA